MSSTIVACVDDGAAGDTGAAGNAGTAGLACWDLDSNGACDPATEDKNSDGTCTVVDCTGAQGAGLTCWDLNMNGTCDLGSEDKNASGGCDVSDCAPSGTQFIANSATPQNAAFSVQKPSKIGAIDVTDTALTVQARGEFDSGNATYMLIRGQSGYSAGTIRDVFRVDTFGGLLAAGTLGYGYMPTYGPGSRMMWSAGKSAFRVGSVDGSQWDNSSVGTLSFAAGYNPIASGMYAAALGNTVTASGVGSIALGSHASTNGNSGAFVLADNSTTTVMTASTANQMSVRASGGIRLYTNSTLTSGVTMAAGASSWSVVSDRNAKTDFKPIDGESVLASIARLPLQTWSYKVEDGKPRHVGPMAQDFRAAFGLGRNEKTIDMLDFDGINMVAIKALEQRTRELQAATAKLDDVSRRLAALEARMERRAR